jgi:hypothetical protein
MRASTAYFAGAGTIVVAIVVGLGGGLMVADIVSPKSPKQGTEMSKLEQRTAPRPIPAAATALEPVPYLNPAQPSAPATVAAVPAQPQAQTEAANAAPVPSQRADTSATTPPELPAQQPATPAAQPAVARQPAAVPDDTLARARDADIKRAQDRRRAEQQRRQQWAERRRQRQPQELREVEVESVREDTEPRRIYTSEPVRMELPQIRLFGSE